jgi:hypothetical protein
MINVIKRKIDANGNNIEFEVFSPNEKLDGKSYGQYLADSWNKLVSDDPDRSDGHILFLRTSVNPKEAPLRKTVKIFSGQAIFLPVISTSMNTNDSPDLDTEPKRRAAANRDTDKGDNPPQPQQVTIDGKPVVDNLKEFRVESPEFMLNVHEQSVLKGKFDNPYRADTLPTVAVGYCVIIKSLPARDRPYTIHIKANGQDGYYTEAIYELQVIDR